MVRWAGHALVSRALDGFWGRTWLWPLVGATAICVFEKFRLVLRTRAESRSAQLTCPRVDSVCKNTCMQARHTAHGGGFVCPVHARVVGETVKPRSPPNFQSVCFC